VSGCGRRGNTRLSKDEILKLLLSRAGRLAGGSTRWLEVEQGRGVEQEVRSWYLTGDRLREPGEVFRPAGMLTVGSSFRF